MNRLDDYDIYLIIKYFKNELYKQSKKDEISVEEHFSRYCEQNSITL